MITKETLNELRERHDALKQKLVFVDKAQNLTVSHEKPRSKFYGMTLNDALGLTTQKPSIYEILVNNLEVAPDTDLGIKK